MQEKRGTKADRLGSTIQTPPKARLLHPNSTIPAARTARPLLKDGAHKKTPLKVLLCRHRHP